MYIASDGIHTAVILRDKDTYIQNPRDPVYQENLGTMTCWHRRYSLGDKHFWDDAQDFAQELASEYVSTQSFLNAVMSNQFQNIRLQDAGNHYNVEIQEHIWNGLGRWSETEWKVGKDLTLLGDQNPKELQEDLLPYASISELTNLCNQSNQVVILPLYLYDHSGRSMSTTPFQGRAPHADWDSGCVGFIYMDKEKAMKELAISGDQIRLTQPIPNYITQQIQHSPTQSVEEALAQKGYTPVRKEDIQNPDSNPLYASWLDQEGIYKKGYQLYVFDRQLSDTSFCIRGPVASFNADILPLTEENWKQRACEILQSEVAEYDCYLRGDIYGILKFNGLAEVESSWNYNPGSQSVEEMYFEMLDGWHPELAGQFQFHPNADDTFDIEEYYLNEDFPSYRKKVEEAVRAYITFEGETSEVYPYGVSAEDLLANRNDILSDIVETIYETHLNPDTEQIAEAILEHAGRSSAITPKITVQDLIPGKEYTAGELMDLLQTKQAPLDKLLSDAVRRHKEQATDPQSHAINPER